MRSLFIFLICLSCLPCRSQQDEQIEVGKTVDRLLRFLSFADSSSLQIDSLRNVFVNDGKLTANFGQKPLFFTVPQYIEGIRNNVRSGQALSSTEKELARKVDIFGKIAHVLSTYELAITGKNGKVVRRGINSIQLIKQEGTWLILSLIWDRESDTLKLPSKYLTN
jgi:hypothetical protein